MLLPNDISVLMRRKFLFAELELFGFQIRVTKQRLIQKLS